VINTPLVGRKRQLATLRDLVQEATDGRGGLVLLAGEAGVGKSRLAREALSNRGALFVDAMATEDGTAPYGPIVVVLRAAFRERPEAVEGLAGLRPHLAALLPEFGPAADPGDRSTLVEALRAAFTAIAAGGPGLVLLDDLHWADAATIELLPALADLAVRQPLAFVGTYRSDDLPRGHPLRRARTELRRAGRLQELVVEPLDRDETRLLAAGVLGGEIGPVLGAALWDRSQGMPFFVEELALALQAGDRVLQTERGLDLATGTQVPLPETVRDAVLARVDGLEPAARSTLEAAAVAGASVELHLLVDLDEEAGVAGALASGFLLDVGDGRVGFRHALTREALYQGTAWTRRRKLHARLCDLLEAACAQPERVAEHAVHSGDPERAVPFLLAAAERFCALHAYRDSVRVGRQALEFWPGADDDPARVDALARLGRCLQLSGEFRQAADAWREVADRRRVYGDRIGEALAQRELATALWYLGRAADAYPLLTASAETFAELGDLAEAARSRVDAAACLHALRDRAAEAEMLRRAQADALKAGEEELRLLALASEGLALAKQRHPAEGLRLAEEALASALAGSFAQAAAHAYWATAAILVQSGDAIALGSTLEQAIEYCQATGEETVRQFCVGCLALVLWKNGNWDQAVELARGVRAVPDPEGTSHGHAALAWGSVESARGHARQARPLIADAMRFLMALGLPGGREAAAALGRLDVARGDADAATDHCRRLLADVRGDAGANFVAPLRWAAAHLASQGLTSETGACAEALARIAADYPHVEVRAALAATLAECAALAGQLEQATAYFAQGLALYDEIEAPFERAETLVRAAETSIALGDREVAVLHLVDAHRAARKLGARPLATLAASRLAELGERIDERIGRRAVADLRPAGLTRRELEVLRHVALGRTNREIAGKLYLSTRTVDMHVRNALAKLDCRTRTQAATRAIELGIVETTASG
jgi:DNA-binding CsgD family transcriptional regulator